MTPVNQQLAPPDGWLTPGQLRIEPMPKTRLRWWERILVWSLLKFKSPLSDISELPGVFTVLMRHRRLFWPWLRFAARLMPGGTLDRSDSELVILRVAWNCRCRYEWGQHVAIGLGVGIEAQEIARVAAGPDASGWIPRRAALLDAVDELHRQRLISESTWQRLSRHYRPEQLIEITILAGHYEMLAGFLNSVGLSLEPQAEEALAQAPIHAPR